MLRGDEFRKRAEECFRLSTQLRLPEYRSFALDLAKAWIGLAEYEERKEAARNTTVTTARGETVADATIVVVARSQMDSPEEPIE
jgi:hypothetical protein